MCEKYMKSFIWIKNLYFDNKYNDWVYDSHYAPPLAYLKEYRDEIKGISIKNSQGYGKKAP